MDRELVFAFLVAALCGCALMAGEWWPARSFSACSTQPAERELWRRIWLPFVPALLVFAMLFGWALDEPASAEPVPRALMLLAVPFAMIFARAVWRTTRSLAVSHEHLTMATVGLFRPQIIVAPRFSAVIDPEVLAAALEHERAHARHRDPLRLWLAQLATELMWPAPAAFIRLQAWKRALEIARDDEARAQGAAGPDLAAAILASLRLSRAVLGPVSIAATLTDDAFIKERITRLLQPAGAEASRKHKLAPLLVVLSFAVPLAILLGLMFGEKLIGSLLTSA
jgi:Zn-dependent protease with chaperone function